MTKKIPVKTFYLFGIIVFSLIFLAVRSTYAMFTASVTINNPITISSSLAYNNELIEYQTITLAAGEEKPFTLNVKSGASINYASWYTCMEDASTCENLVINATKEGDPPSGNISVPAGSSEAQKAVKIRLKNGGSSPINVRVGVVGGSTIILSDGMILIPEASFTATINKSIGGTVTAVETINASNQTVSISGTEDYPNYNSITCTNGQTAAVETTTSSGIMTANIKLNSLTSDTACTALFSNTLQNFITNLYNKTSKQTINANDGINYNLAPSVALMADNNYSPNLPAGNIRYYGKNPNNRVYFNCSDYNDTSTCETWYIIGAFAEGIKLWSPYYNQLSWDYTVEGASLSHATNNWSQSSLFNLLNTGYLNSRPAQYYNDSLTPELINFTSTGIKPNPMNKKLISPATWYLGGYGSSDMYPSAMYTYERGNKVYSGNPTSTTAPIGLIYPSDYGYASDLSKCNQTLLNYNKVSDCYQTNYLFSDSWSYTGTALWFITPYSDDINGVFYADASGAVHADSLATNHKYIARPTLYLNSNASVISGDGSSSKPYVLAAQ